MSVARADGPASPRGFPGEPGLWLFVFADMTVFAGLFAITLVVRAQQPETFAAGSAQLHTGLGTVNTLLLVTGSLLVALAARAVRRDAPVERLVLGAVGCAAAFVAIKGVEWALLFHGGHTVSSSDFFALYFMLTGIHLGHVVIGIGALAYARVRAREGVFGVRAVEGAASYWHMVDLLWLLLFPLLYLVG